MPWFRIVSQQHAERLDVLKRRFWGTAAPEDMFYLAAAERRFLVRDRLAKKSLKVEKLHGKDRKDVLQAQASEMGRVHAAAWGAAKKDEIRTWLLDNVDALTSVWSSAYEAAKAGP